MRKPTSTTLVIASVVLGLISPFVAELCGHEGDPSMAHGLLYAWFYTGPITAAQILWFVEDTAMLGLAMVVYILQYLGTLSVLRACWPLAEVVRDFYKPYRHRVGLMQRN